MLRHLAIAIALIGAQASAPHDFAAVDSRAKAQKLAAEAKLVAIFLFPKEFGGANLAANRVYVTPEAAAERAMIIDTMTEMIRRGELDKMDVDVDYRGTSVVPTRIYMRAAHSSRNTRFARTVEVW